MPAPTREQLAETLSRVYFESYDKTKSENDKAGRDAWLNVADVVLADMKRLHELVIEVSYLRRQLGGELSPLSDGTRPQPQSAAVQS